MSVYLRAEFLVCRITLTSFRQGVILPPPPPPQNEPLKSTHRLGLNRIGAILEYYSQKYDNVIIIGDFNFITENTHFQSMMQACNLNNLIKEPTCFSQITPAKLILY